VAARQLAERSGRIIQPELHTMTESGRDIRNHYLFEIATEVANRGDSFGPIMHSRYLANRVQLVGYIPSSNPKLQLPLQNMETGTHSSGLLIGIRYVSNFEDIFDLANQVQAAVEVEALTPTNPMLAATIESMEERGISILYGRWLIEGAPRVLLIDTKTAHRFLDEWKADLWNTAGIPSPPGDEETNEAVVFGYLVAWFLGEV
jgi:glycogen synthase